MYKTILFFALAFCMLNAGLTNALAIPQFALLSGNKCISCHILSQGGGLRGDLGAYARNEASLIPPKTVGLEGLYSFDPKRNTMLDGKITFGMDFRLQMARSHKTEEAETKIFPMQAAIYAQYAPTDWVSVEGAVNVGHKRFGDSQTSNYPGQQPWSASVLIQPASSWPGLRVGLLQPSIGIRYDDHTKITRQAPGADGINNPGSSSIIPPIYGEYGAEITYDALRDWTFSAGVFGSRALSEVRIPNKSGNDVSLISSQNLPSMAIRAEYMPRLLENKINTVIGGSYFTNDDFSMINGFVGVGLTDKLSLTADYARSEKKNIRITNTTSIEAMYQLLESLFLCARAESGVSTIDGIDEYTKQLVLGAQVFILPCIELRPEYRIMDADFFRSSRWAAQLHIFY